AVHASRPTVNHNQQWVLLRRIVIGRFDQDSFYRGAVSRFPLYDFAGRQLESVQLVPHCGQPLGLEDTNRRRIDFGVIVWASRRERHYLEVLAEAEARGSEVIGRSDARDAACLWIQPKEMRRCPLQR